MQCVIWNQKGKEQKGKFFLYFVVFFCYYK